MLFAWKKSAYEAIPSTVVLDTLFQLKSIDISLVSWRKYMLWGSLGWLQWVAVIYCGDKRNVLSLHKNVAGGLRGGGGGHVFGADPVDIHIAFCLSPKWVDFDLTQIHYWGKVLNTFWWPWPHYQGHTRAYIVGKWLVCTLSPEGMDEFRLNRHEHKLIRFWWPWPYFQGHTRY